MNKIHLKFWSIVWMTLCCTVSSQAQKPFNSLDDYFSKYEIVQIETSKIIDDIKSSNSTKIRLSINSWNLILQKSDIISDKYVCTNEHADRFTNVTDGLIVPLNGYTTQGNRVSITIGNDFIQGFIKEQDRMVYIEPVYHFVQGAKRGDFVIYNEADIIPGKERLCGVNASHYRGNGGRAIENRSVLVGNCYEIEYAIATDYSMFAHYGSISAVEAHNIAVVNDMQTNYDDEFNDELRFNIVQQYIVSTQGGDPWTSSTSANTLLNSFTSWAPNGFSTTHDLGTLWTRRDLDGSTVGLAWVDAVCSSYRYNILEDFTSNASLKRVLSAHEIGHNFSATHDASQSNFIMTPSVTSSTVWSTASQSSINNAYPNYNCLGSCTPLTPEVNFLLTSYQISETGGISDNNYCVSPYKTITIPVKSNRSTQNSTTIGVSIISGGSALSGRDFVLKTTTLTFPSGSVSTQYISIDIINDAIEEEDEDFTLKLTWISGPAQVGDDDECLITIKDGLDVVSNICCSPGSYVTYGSYNYYAALIFLSAADDSRSRFLYLPNHLTTTGISAGFLSGVAFNTYQKNSNQPFNNFRVGLKNVDITTLDGAPWYNTEEVFIGSISTSQGNWTTIEFDQPFYWDGTSALYFEFCFDNTSHTSSHDLIGASTPVGGGTGQYDEALVANDSQGCLLDSGASRIRYSPSIQPHLRFYQLGGVKVENVLNKVAKTSISAGETAHLYSDDQNIIASIKNLGTTDIGCLEAKVATTGNNKKTLPFGNGSYADKTIQIIGDADALYEVTLYYSSGQMTTWGTSAGKLNILKSNVSIANATLNDVEIVRPDTVYSSLGQDNAYAYKTVFSGFSWFTLTDYNKFNDISVTGSDLIFEVASAGILLQNNSDEVYKLNVNNSGQLNATSIAPTNYKTIADADGLQIVDSDKGVIFKSPNNSNWRLTVSNSGQLITNSVTTLPPVNVKQQTGNFSVDRPGSSLILKSANGNCWRVLVNEEGQLRSANIICP